MNTSMTRVKSSDFIAGYCYKSIEYATAKGTNAFKEIPDDGFVGDAVFPKVWVGGKHDEDVENAAFSNKMEDVMQQLTDTFVATYGKHFQLLARWEEYAFGRANIAINYRILKQEPKKMTVTEIEKALGYKIEIVSEE